MKRVFPAESMMSITVLSLVTVNTLNAVLGDLSLRVSAVVVGVWGLLAHRGHGDDRGRQ